MPRSNLRLALGGLAALAVGLVGGWARFALPLDTPAPAMISARLSIATGPSADEPAPSVRTPARWVPTNPEVAPTPKVEAPPPPAGDVATPQDAPKKPHLHLDGERSTFSYDGEAGSLSINKDRLRVRTPFGKLDLDW
jgi:hypothetical protein